MESVQQVSSGVQTWKEDLRREKAGKSVFDFNKGAIYKKKGFMNNSMKNLKMLFSNFKNLTFKTERIISRYSRNFSISKRWMQEDTVKFLKITISTTDLFSKFPSKRAIIDRINLVVGESREGGYPTIWFLQYEKLIGYYLMVNFYYQTEYKVPSDMFAPNSYTLIFPEDSTFNSQTGNLC